MTHLDNARSSADEDGQKGRAQANITMRMRRSTRLATRLVAICPNVSPRKAAQVTSGGLSRWIRARICWDQTGLSSDESTSEMTAKPADGRSSPISSGVARKLLEESLAHGCP
jgi:hypothetical protein